MSEVHFDHLGVSYHLPDEPTVLEVLAYDSKHMELQAAGQPALVALWDAAKTVITGWQCDTAPWIGASFADLGLTEAEVKIAPRSPEEAAEREAARARARANAPRIARIIELVGLHVSGWRRALEEVPKN